MNVKPRHDNHTNGTFRPFLDEKTGRRRFDKELAMLLKTKSSRAKSIQFAWQCDPDVIKWCETHKEHWERLVREYGYNVN